MDTRTELGGAVDDDAFQRGKELQFATAWQLTVAAKLLQEATEIVLGTWSDADLDALDKQVLVATCCACDALGNWRDYQYGEEA